MVQLFNQRFDVTHLTGRRKVLHPNIAGSQENHEPATPPTLAARQQHARFRGRCQCGSCQLGSWQLGSCQHGSHGQRCSSCCGSRQWACRCDGLVDGGHGCCVPELHRSHGGIPRAKTAALRPAGCTTCRQPPPGHERSHDPHPPGPLVGTWRRVGTRQPGIWRRPPWLRPQQRRTRHNLLGPPIVHAHPHWR